jgi:DNA-binding NarL/FixJ family response regulator
VSEGRLRVVIIDDHDLFSQGLVLLLASKAGHTFEVGGRTSHVEEALALVEEHNADLAIVDLAMPPLGGAAAIRQIKERRPGTRVLAISGAEDLELAEHALRAGADGYLPKSADPDVLVAPLLAIAAGFRVLDARLTENILHASRKPPPELLERLSDQDILLWRLLSRGLETSDIARRLLVSERTAKRQLSALLNKIGAGSRIEAAGLAGQFGLLDSDDLPDIQRPG